jgi:hypothetical protein
MNVQQQQEKSLQEQGLKQKQNRKLSLHKETIKELTDDQLQNAAGGTSGTILLTLISLREHICL